MAAPIYFASGLSLSEAAAWPDALGTFVPTMAPDLFGTPLILFNTYESGQPNGTTITTGNSGGGAGTAFSAVTIGASATVTYTTPGIDGTLAGTYTTSGSAAIARTTWSGTAIPVPQPRLQGQAIANPTSLTPSQTPIMRLVSGGTQGCRISINSTGKVSLRDTASTTVLTSAGTMTTASTWTIKWDVSYGPAAPATMYIWYSWPPTANPDETLTGTGNFGSTTFDQADFGVGATTANAAVRLDNLFVTDQGLGAVADVWATDTWQTTDAVTTQVAYTRTATDTWQTSDAATGRLTFARTASDAFTTADSVTRATADLRAVTDGWQTSDAATAGSALARAIADGWQTSDATTTSTALIRAVVDAFTTADAATRTPVIMRAVADGWLTAEDVSRLLILSRTAVDSIDTADSAVGHSHVPRAVTFYVGRPVLPWLVGDPTNSWDIGLPVLPWIVGRAVVPVTSVSAEATMYVQIPVTALVSGLPSDPTGDTVSLAFMLGRATPDTPDWVLGSWQTSSVNGQYFAQALVGPTGHVLTPGVYTVWIKIEDDPETPIAQSGNLTVY